MMRSENKTTQQSKEMLDCKDQEEEFKTMRMSCIGSEGFVKEVGLEIGHEG